MLWLSSAQKKIFQEQYHSVNGLDSDQGRLLFAKIKSGIEASHFTGRRSRYAHCDHVFSLKVLQIAAETIWGLDASSTILLIMMEIILRTTFNHFLQNTHSLL